MFRKYLVNWQPNWTFKIPVFDMLLFAMILEDNNSIDLMYVNAPWITLERNLDIIKHTLRKVVC